jgi:hypothetical protein
MNTETYFLPSHLLSYLFNGDASELTDQEEAEYNAWEVATFPHGAWAVSSVPAGFRRTNDMNNTGGDCREVVFQTNDDPNEPPLEDCISAADLAVIQAMRARGWAVALFTPAELEAIDSEDVENQMIAAGNNCIAEWLGGAV